MLALKQQNNADEGGFMQVSIADRAPCLRYSFFHFILNGNKKALIFPFLTK
jgi:hypothetical protein